MCRFQMYSWQSAIELNWMANCIFLFDYSLDNEHLYIHDMEVAMVVATSDGKITRT